MEPQCGSHRSPHVRTPEILYTKCGERVGNKANKCEDYYQVLRPLAPVVELLLGEGEERGLVTIYCIKIRKWSC
jgi:hypothetical protein